MQFNGYVALRRGIAEHLHDGRLTTAEFAALVCLIMLADSSTGQGCINGPCLHFYLPDLSYDACKRVLKSLQTKGYIWRKIIPYSKNLYRFWVNGYRCTTGPHKLLQINLSQVFETGDIIAIEYINPALDLSPEGALDPALEGAREGAHNNNKDKEKDKQKREHLVGNPASASACVSTNTSQSTSRNPAVSGAVCASMPASMSASTDVSMNAHQEAERLAAMIGTRAGFTPAVSAEWERGIGSLLERGHSPGEVLAVVGFMALNNPGAIVREGVGGFVENFATRKGCV